MGVLPIRSPPLRELALTVKVGRAIVVGNNRATATQGKHHRMSNPAARSSAASEQLSVEDAIRGRQSIRAFEKRPVARDLIRRVLETANRAPSGSNIQPWKAYIVDGSVRDRLCAEILERYDTVGEEKREYNYYPVTWREPYLARRRACGWGLYSTMGITREDKAGMHAQRRQNFDFFGAPVGIIFTLDRDMEIGSWLDCGMFIQSAMIAARQFGLETCPQAAFANFHQIIRRRLVIPDDQVIICGMALGYPEKNAKVNTFRTEREPFEVYARFVDTFAD
jgi:nitroreductase